MDAVPVLEDAAPVLIELVDTIPVLEEVVDTAPVVRDFWECYTLDIIYVQARLYIVLSVTFQLLTASYFHYY